MIFRHHLKLQIRVETCMLDSNKHDIIILAIIIASMLVST